MKPKLIKFNKEIEKKFYDMAAEYLPGSSQDRMHKFYPLYPEVYNALMLDDEIIGVVYGWPRKLVVPEDETFTLDGIAVRAQYQKKGYGKMLLNAFEDAVKGYKILEITVGSEKEEEAFYMNCGYTPIQYKVWENDKPVLVKEFNGIEDYKTYKQPDADGFVVLSKRLF